MPNDPNQNTSDPNNFLMGGGVPSAAFLKVGASVSGTICEPPVLRQQRDIQTGAPKSWDDGSPMMQLVITLQTDERDAKIEDDDGRRRIYVKFNMKNAVADAVRRAGGKGLEVGGKLTVKYVKDGEQTKKGFNPPKLYEATYTPPSAAFLDEPEPAAAATPMTLAQGVAYCEARGMDKAAMLSNLKAAGFSRWEPAGCTAAVLKMCAQLEAPLTDDMVPF